MRNPIKLFLLMSLAFVSFYQSSLEVSASQPKPTVPVRAKLTLREVMNGLTEQKNAPRECRTLPGRNSCLAKMIRKFGISFKLTAEIKGELELAGANAELLEAIKAVSPAVASPTAMPTPMATPTPKPTPTPIPAPPPIPPAESNPAGTVRRTSIGLLLVWIREGAFMMGASVFEIQEAKAKCNPKIDECQRHFLEDATPQKQVTFKEGFWAGKTEVTVRVWKLIMGSNPSQVSKDCDECPVTNVSYTDIQEFLRRVNERDTEFDYRLITEAEWEYITRAGSGEAFTYGRGLNSNQANINGRFPYNSVKGKSLGKPAPVASYQENDWKVNDLHGNVREWVQDIASSSYENTPTDGSANLKIGDLGRRVIRGGSFSSSAWSARSAFRDSLEPNVRLNDLGFRIVAQRKKKLS